MDKSTSLLLRGMRVGICVAVIAFAAMEAYNIRLYAVKTYGKVIHEFDPWFNFRATQYLADHGAKAFFTWYDHEVWYPLGRPVGTTIYPGMQFTAVGIWRFLQTSPVARALGLPAMSLNDVCVYIPAWFGVLATLATGLLAWEVSGRLSGAAAATAVMAVIPAHIMRSVAGGFDNESVAMTAMCLSFFLWCRSLRTPRSWPLGVIAGLAYAYMGAAWGGYVFVGNMIGVHAAVSVLIGHWSPLLHRAYSLWYIVSTALIIQIPVVGNAPLRSAEQLGPLAVFLVMQLLWVCDIVDRRRKVTLENNRREYIKLRLTVAAIAVTPLLLGWAFGYFGPLSSRVRSLFVPHTKTGNPLVDSVAEHQPASVGAYLHYLNFILFLLPVGFVITIRGGGGVFGGKEKRKYGINVTKHFILLYCIIAYYFSNKMVRLLLLLGPVASVLGGIAIGTMVEWSITQLGRMMGLVKDKEDPVLTAAIAADAVKSSPQGKHAAVKKVKKAAITRAEQQHPLAQIGLSPLVPTAMRVEAWSKSSTGILARALAATVFFIVFFNLGTKFYGYCHAHAEMSSAPSIMFRARLNNGQEIIVDDYREGYWWLRDNTPTDSRVLAWWDYGYQINGIANRTSLADGNTWNLEHIATIGRILTSPEKKAHELARHLADYVLIWAGNHGDDLAKSPHMARIGSSVYPDVCPRDPLCKKFGFYSGGRPTPMMANSILYKMHSNTVVPGVTIDESLFKHVFTSKHGLIRIYQIQNVSQESKAWIADPANWKCDHPGSWYCVGQYPPGFPKPPSTHRHITYSSPQDFV